MLDFEDITDIFDFPEEYGSFRDFDNLLRCPICKEFLNPTLFLTNCQHYGCRYEYNSDFNFRNFIIIISNNTYIVYIYIYLY